MKRTIAVTMPPATMVLTLVALIFLLAEAAAVDLAPVQAGDPEPASIRTVLSQAPSYHLHMVTLEGVTSNLRILPPVPRISEEGGCVVYGMATFTLDDGTGSLPVELFGSCSPQAVTAPPKDGEVVRVTATIHVLSTDPPFRARAHAHRIGRRDLK